MERYDSYKDSGVDWIGQIPEHWNLRKIKSVSIFNPSKKTANLDLVGYAPMECIRTGAIEIRSISVKQLPTGLTYFENGDLVVAKVTPCFENNNIAIAKNLTNGCAFGSSELFVFRPTNICDKFLFYYFQDEQFKNQCCSTMRGTGGLKRVQSDFVLNAKIPYPDLSEQQAIVAYLDEETGKLDAAVEKLERMVEVLKERKQLIISKAVTRGLDDSVPLKDSGIEWIGQIPEHWEIIKLKYISSIKGRIGWNGLRSEEFEDSSYAYLVTGQDFKGSNIVWSDCYQINQKRYEEDPEIQLKNGDLLITKDGSIGKVAKVSELDKPACLNSGIFVIKPKEAQYIQGFMYWLLNSIVFKSYTDFSKTGATISHLYQNVFEKMPCVLPSIKEQQAIAAYLDEKVGKLDEAIEKQLRMIELLKERKQILISDVVTGKIKVA